MFNFSSAGTSGEKEPLLSDKLLCPVVDLEGTSSNVGLREVLPQEEYEAPYRHSCLEWLSQGMLIQCFSSQLNIVSFISNP